MKIFKLMLIIIFLYSFSNIKGQNNNYTHNCTYDEEPETNVEWENFVYKIDNKHCNKKGIRINIHFMLKEDGTGNFTETDDGMGGPMTGYQLANDATNYLNYIQQHNSSLNLPPNNGENIPVDKNFYYILEGVYFHRDDDYYCYSNLSPYGSNNVFTEGYVVNNENVINIFLGDNCNGDESCNDGGQAYKSKNYIRIQGTNCLFRKYTYPNPTNWWYPKGFASLLAHELGHIQSLQHTVRFGWGGKIPVEEMAFRSSQDVCDSLYFTTTNMTQYINYLEGFPSGGQPTQPPIEDTPTPWQLFDQYGRTCHPACGSWKNWDYEQEWNSICSNNQMDYNGRQALSKDQINRAHFHLDQLNSQFPTRACLEVNVPKHFCSFSYPQVAYYGSFILIDDCSSGNTNIVKDQTIIVYNEDVVIENTEIVTGFSHTKLGNSFEIRYECSCE